MSFGMLPSEVLLPPCLLSGLLISPSPFDLSALLLLSQMPPPAACEVPISKSNLM